MMTEGEKKKKQKKSTDDNEDKINDVKEVLMTIRKEIKTKIQQKNTDENENRKRVKEVSLTITVIRKMIK